MPVIRKVPFSSGQIPNCGSAKSGDHSSSVKNREPTSWKNGIDSLEQRDQDPDRRQDRDRGGEEQQGADDLLAPATALDAERAKPSRRRACHLCAGFHRSIVRFRSRPART